MEAIPENQIVIEEHIDLDSICRVCRSKSNLLNIFKANSIIDIATEIFNLTSVKIIKDDNFPQNICFTCIHILNTCVSFKTICLETNKFLEENFERKKDIDISNKTERSQNVEDFHDCTDKNFDTAQHSDSDDELLLELHEFIKDKNKNTSKKSDSDLLQEDLIGDDKLLSELEEFVKDKSSTKKSNSDKQNDDKKTKPKDEDDVDEHHEDFLVIPTRKRSAEYRKKLSTRLRKFAHVEKQSDLIEKRVDLLLQREEEKLNNQNDYAKKVYSRTKAPIKCECCCLFLATKEDLIDHLHRLKHPKRYRQSLGSICKHCDDYVEPGKMKQHLQTHYESKLSRHSICDICGIMTRPKNMKRHMYVHLGEQQRPYKCEICKKGYTQKGFLDDHMNIHLGLKPYMCDTCGKSFSQTSQFYQHRRKQHGYKRALENKNAAPKEPKVDNYKCDICDLTLSNTQSFKDHLAVHGIEYLQCNYCDNLFATEAELKTHETQHAQSSNTKIYECDICERQFTSSPSIRNHMRVHDDIKTHVCKECGKAFHKESSLNLHLKTHNSKKKHKTISLKSTAHVEEDTEDQQGLYECSYCPKTFSDTGSLRRHFWQKHGNVH